MWPLLLIAGAIFLISRDDRRETADGRRGPEAMVTSTRAAFIVIVSSRVSVKTRESLPVRPPLTNSSGDARDGRSRSCAVPGRFVQCRDHLFSGLASVGDVAVCHLDVSTQCPLPKSSAPCPSPACVI